MASWTPPVEMATSLDQTQLQRSTSERNVSTMYFNGLVAATAAPLRPRLGRSILRFSPYGKSLTEERNILVTEGKSSYRVLESESFRRRGSLEEKTLGSWQPERAGAKANANEESEKSNGLMLECESNRRGAEEVKAMEVFSKELKSLELSN